jgi:hypothetical protein
VVVAEAVISMSVRTSNALNPVALPFHYLSCPGLSHGLYAVDACSMPVAKWAPLKRWYLYFMPNLKCHHFDMVGSPY